MGTDGQTAARAMTPSEPPDGELLSAIAEGDRQAYATLYRRYAPILLGLLIRIFRDRSEAEDVLQEAFVQIWKRAGDFDERRGRAIHWLATVARNRALDRLSTLRTRERITASQPPDPLPEEAPDPVDEASVAEDARHLHRALDHIPEAERRVLLLAYFEGLSQSQIAERLGTPLGTVKSHARLGLARLREALARDHRMVRK